MKYAISTLCQYLKISHQNYPEKQWQIQVKSMYNHFHNLCFCSLAKTLISLAMFNFYFILIKDLETQCDVLCCFFFPYKKIIPQISEASRILLTKAKIDITHEKKLYWGKYYKYKHTCTFSSFLMKLIAPQKTTSVLFHCPSSIPPYKGPAPECKHIRTACKNSWPAGNAHGE